MERRSVRLLTVLSLTTCSAAWGPLFEPAKGGFGFVTSPLKATTSDRDGESSNSYRASLERSFALEYSEDLSRLLQPAIPVDLHIAEDDILGGCWSFGVAEGDTDSLANCSGEDCEEDCPIPEKFKILSVEASKDVMEFLGIRRAEPLRVTGRSRDWE